MSREDLVVHLAVVIVPVIEFAVDLLALAAEPLDGTNSRLYRGHCGADAVTSWIPATVIRGLRGHPRRLQ